MSTPRRNLGKQAKELYDLVAAAKGQLTIEEIARKTGIRQQLITHYVVQYAVDNGLGHTIQDILRFKVPETRVTPKSIKRKDGTTFIQISSLRLDQADLTEVTNFKIVPSPKYKAVLIVPDELECVSFEDALSRLGFTPEGGIASEFPEHAEKKAEKPVVTDLSTRRRKRADTKSQVI